MPMQPLSEAVHGLRRSAAVLAILVPTLSVAALGVPFASPAVAAPAEADGGSPGFVGHTPAQVYRGACANCHGADGTGVAPSVVGFDTPLPDFTDCSFATREPDADWYAVAHDGGPVRGFANMMPALGGALTSQEIHMALSHVRTFCPDDAWPRGELNLPRALYTEKAYPEDEMVFTTVVDTEGDGAVSNEFVYETRFGARNQVELVVPFGWRERAVGGAGGDVDTDWDGGLGNAAIGFKRAVYHSLERGSIFSVTGEVILPTGDQDEGFGGGYALFEPFVSWGQILPADSFLQLQAGGEIPLESGHDEEAFARMALGRSFTEDRFGRVWSPMVEVLAARELVSGADTSWDVVPQFQVTLNTRQHVMANFGVRIPLTDTDVRDTQVVAYLLWDFFDGGFFQGW